MQRINFWRKLPLRGLQIALIVFLTSSDAFGQYTWDVNLPHYDERKMHYGFTLGLNSTRYRAKLSDVYFSDSLKQVKTLGNGGFSLGFIGNFRLGEFYDLRTLITVSFYQRQVNYVFQSNRSNLQAAEAVFIEFPILFKYKSMRRKNHRMYVLGGLKPGIEAGAKKREKKNSELRTNNLDLCLDYGLGIDLYFKYFKFSPELRFSHGFINLLNKDPNLYSESLLKLTTHTVSLYLHFQ
ncbi:MAG: PorT family protein [Cytophagaceae bacterium]|jgi:hypothetical protein|nr:PorT family protein [Cytophagaceae bacterium]